jgi:hypothetical protein
MMRTIAVSSLAVLLLFGIATTSFASIQTQLTFAHGRSFAQEVAQEIQGTACKFTDICTDSLAAFGSWTTFDSWAAFDLCDVPIPLVGVEKVAAELWEPAFWDAPWEIIAPRQHSRSDPSGIVVWSLLGLCWAGGSCWRQQQGQVRMALLAHRQRVRCRTRRAPWPDHVRAAILRIIAKDSSQ